MHGQVLRPEVRRGRIWLHFFKDACKCMVRCFALRSGAGESGCIFFLDACKCMVRCFALRSGAVSVNRCVCVCVCVDVSKVLWVHLSRRLCETLRHKAFVRSRLEVFGRIGCPRNRRTPPGSDCRGEP